MVRGIAVATSLHDMAATVLIAHGSLHVQARETLVAHVSDCDNALHGSSVCVAATLSLLSLLLEVRG
jgi:hypothetical protein